MRRIRINHYIGKQVKIEDSHVIARVTAINIKSNDYIIYNLEWMDDGRPCSGWFEEFQLEEPDFEATPDPVEILIA